MAITRAKKEEIVEKVHNAVSKAQSVVFVNFHKVSVADQNTMRKELRANKVNYLVAKKTLIRRALLEAKVSGEMPELEGEIALAYGGDLIIPARLIQTFSKKYKENLAIVGGVFEGKFMDKFQMNEIASIPPIEILYAQLVRLIHSPIQGLALALGQIEAQKQ